MFLIFLTLLDIFSFIVVFLMQSGVIDGWRLPLACALYLLGKAYMFRTSFLSILDGLVGIYLILQIFGIYFWFIYFVIGLLVYKLVSLAA